MSAKKTVRKIIGENIKRLREEKQILQKDIEEYLGLKSNGHMSLIEKGERGLSPDKIMRLAELFGVHPSSLFMDKPTNNEYAHYMGMLSNILLSEHKSASLEAMKALIKAVAKECAPAEKEPEQKSQEVAI